MTQIQKLEASIRELTPTVLKCKRERDALLAAAKQAIKELGAWDDGFNGPGRAATILIQAVLDAEK